MATAVLDPAIDMLLSSPEPVIRYRALLDLAGATPDDARVRATRQSIPSGPIVRELLTERTGKHPYSKWVGLHWRLASLTDLGVPSDTIDPATLDPELAWLTGR